MAVFCGAIVSVPKTVCVHIGIGDEAPRIFNGYKFPLNDFSSQRDNKDLSYISDAIFKGLNSKDSEDSEDSFVYLTINAFVKLGAGQHVFPSQEMNLGEKEKVLFQLDGCAALHSVKVGNAIRTIDDWYGTDKTPAKFPIAVEPFGAVTQQGQAYRKTKTDLYTLMLNWVNNKDMTQSSKTLCWLTWFGVVFLVESLTRRG